MPLKVWAFLIHVHPRVKHVHPWGGQGGIFINKITPLARRQVVFPEHRFSHVHPWGGHGVYLIPR